MCQSATCSSWSSTRSFLPRTAGAAPPPASGPTYTLSAHDQEMEKGMKVTFSWRLIAAIAGTTAVAGGCLAGGGSSSPTVTVTASPGATSASSSAANAAKPGAAGLPAGQGTFQIRGSVTEFD